MDKGKVVAICIFILALALIYADQNSKDTEPTPLPDNPTKKNPPGNWGPSTPIIIPPTLNLSVYQDANCTINLATIDWGTMYPGGSKSQIIYVKNTGNGDVAPALYTTNWVFKDYNGTVLSSDYLQYFNLSWDREGIVIKPSEVVNATLTLSISPFITDVASFTFDIYLGWQE